MKQRKLGKRIASLVLAAVMLLTYIPATTWAVDAGTDIKAIAKPTGWSIVENYDDYFGDEWTAKLELPETVAVTLADDSTVSAAVTWDTTVLDPRTPGYYYLPGEVTLPGGATNGQNLTVSITVQVREKSNLLTNPSFESGKTGWGIGSSSKPEGTPAADGEYALQVRSHANAKISYNMMFPSDPAALAESVINMGAGQYYVGVKVRDYLYDGETAHTDFLQAYIRLCYKTNASASSSSSKGNTTAVTINDEGYVTTEGVFEITGEEVWLRPDLYLKSDTAFAAQWVLVDSFELIPLKVSLQAEPAVIASVKTQVQSRFIALNYDKYVGENWQEALGLPETVEVLTENNDTISVGVTWNYSSLNLTQVGKYTLTGTLDDGGCPNPNNITVQQILYVRKVENLYTNPSFESGKTGWGIGNSSNNYGTPSAVDEYALQVRSNAKLNTDFNMIFPGTAYQTSLAAQVAEIGAGQYYIGAQVRDFLHADEIAHTDALSTYIEVKYKTDINATSASSMGKSDEVTINSDSYVAVGGVFEMTGEEVWLRPDLHLTSETQFTSQWVLVDDMQFIALNILISVGEEPSDMVEITEEIPTRAVVQNYNKYVGENWQEALGLPSYVNVLTGKGTTVEVNVTWDFSELDLTTVGKYTLIGMLDDTAYPNPDGLQAKQVIYIREYKNLYTNPSFEGGKNGWSYGSSIDTNGTPAALGKYALQVRSTSNTSSNYNMLFPSSTYQTELAEQVALEGAGQYYIGAQVRDFLRDGETAHTDALQTYIQVNYKTDPDATSSSKKGATVPVTISDDAYVVAGGVFDMTGEEVWLRPDLYLKSDTKFTAQWVLVDDMQFVPLNVVIKTYEGSAEEVQTVIPDRNIILNYQDYIDGYTTADLMFPETVEVRSTTGEIVVVDVKWNYDNLDLTKLGTYTLTGVLDDMRLSNSKGLTVDQVVHVVEYQNLMINGGFEDADDNWNHGSYLSVSGAARPRFEGDYSLELKFSRLDNYATDNDKELSFQAFYSAKMTTLGQAITATGAGRYYFGIAFQGGESADDYQIHARLLYKNVAKGDTTTSTSTPKAYLDANQFNQIGNLVEIPDDVYWSRMDIYFNGSVNAVRSSTLYLDKAELVPLNVAVPNMTDIISCETPASIYVHAGTSVSGLNLPSTLEIMLKNGQRFEMAVTWDTSSYDPDFIGEQTVTGTLNLGDKYKNPKGFVPSVKITVRAKGEDLRQTIYISNDGSEDNDGLSPETPKKEITNLSTYLQQGYNVRLKRGDTWYMDRGSFSISDVYGTEDVPVVVGAYGSGDELPIIAFMTKIENSAWTLVDAERNIYAADVSALGQKNGISVHRCFVNDAAFCHRERTNYVALKEEEYCSYNYTLYVRMPEGEVPNSVEVTPYSSGQRITISDSAHLTFEQLHIQGGSAVNALIRINAPTEYIKIQYCSITHCNYYIIVMESDDEQVNYRPEISYCFIDAMYSVEEGETSGDGGRNSEHWDAHLTEGICMRDGVEEAWIHHNHIRNMSHAFIAIECLKEERLTNYKIRGVFNTVIEDNLMEGGNVKYTRALNLAGGGKNASGLIMSRDNTVRRNYCYDMSTSSHLYGENILVYSNVISYVHCAYRDSGILYDGKSAQPYAFDSIDPGQLSGAIVVNNTCYNASSFIALYESSAVQKYDNVIANNLMVNWTSDAGAVYGTAGAFYDNANGISYFMNNAVYSTEGRIDHFVVDGLSYQVDQVNGVKAGYSGNLCGDPKFANADLSQMVYGARLDFTLSSESPYRYAGLSANASIYKTVAPSAWERMIEDYTDINGVAYLAESPSIGAYSYSERVSGEVASVGTLEDIVVRTGATYESLPLPDSVSAVNDQGIDVVLLIDWSDANYDGSKSGTVMLTGTLRNGPHTNLNVEGKSVSVNIQLKDRLQLVDIVTNVYAQAVPFGTSFEDALKTLPQTLHVVEEHSFEEDIPVTWACENYDGTKPDTYIFKCVFPADMLTNPDEFELEVEVQVMRELFRGSELLENPDFIEGTSSAPWTVGWGTGSFKITQDAQYLLPGEPASAIVTIQGRYGSVQQDVTGQVKMMGDGKYLFRCYMRIYKHLETMDSSYACLAFVTDETTYYRCRTKTDIGEEWVEYSMIMDLENVEDVTKVVFHTSTGKSTEDIGKSFVISGCSFIYLGNTDAEVEATLDSIELDWNMIKGENSYDKTNVMSDLTLPARIGAGSVIKWTSSDESVISNDGKVTMGRVSKEVTLTATVTYNGIETIKKFELTVPRDPELPTFSGAISGSQTVNVGDEFQVTISLTGEKASSFNAYRFTLSFNTSKLEYIGCSDAASTVEVEGGKITVSGIGAERPVTDTITLTFKAKKSGITEVKLVKAEMDLDANASLDNLPTMTVTEGAALIDVQKVEEIEGTEVAEKDNSSVIWIVIGLVAAALLCGGVIMVILIRKRKQKTN